MPTTRSANAMPTAATGAGKAAQALLDGLQALAPTIPSSEVHWRLHRVAKALQGVTVHEVLDGLTRPDGADGGRGVARSPARWSLTWMRREPRQARVDAESCTVDALVQALGGRVIGWRPTT